MHNSLIRRAGALGLAALLASPASIAYADAPESPAQPIASVEAALPSEQGATSQELLPQDLEQQGSPQQNPAEQPLLEQAASKPRKTGWIEDETGRIYIDPETKKQVFGWLDLEDQRFYLDPESGYMATGWLELEDQRFYLDPESGQMVTGWLELEGARYYFLPDEGCMLTGWFIAPEATFYLLPESGQACTGWKKINGYWYFFNEDGSMKTGWHLDADDGHWYYLDDDGTMLKNRWLKWREGWYFLNRYGDMHTGACYEPSTGNWYVLGRNGKMLTGYILYEGNYYFAKNSGVVLPISNWAPLNNRILETTYYITGRDLRSCYDYVVHNFTYRSQETWPSYPDWEEDYAQGMLDYNSGNCYAFASLFRFLAKACGYTGMEVKQGYIRNPANGVMLAHSWCELTKDGQTYIFDPELEYEWNVDSYCKLKGSTSLEYIG